MTQGSFAVATIDDVIAHLGIYIVALPHGPTPAAEILNLVGGQPIGAKPVAQYPAKTNVLVYYHPNWSMSYILGAVPGAVTRPELAAGDSIALRAPVGFVHDAYHFGALAGNLPNFSCGRPVDTLPGDWGMINELGLMFFLGRLGISLRATDAAKLEAFYGDDLVRLTAQNFEFWTGGREERMLLDEREYSEVRKSTPYAWEAVGVGQPKTPLFKIQDKPLKAGETQAPVEPLEVDQTLIPRQLLLCGYLGDGEHEFIAAPPADLLLERESARTRYHGLLHIHKSMTGAYAVRSAKEITLEKSVLIAVPKELAQPDDPAGDTGPGYLSAGVGDAEMVVPEFTCTPEGGAAAAQLFDAHAWFYGKYTAAQFSRHSKDWYLPEADELGGTDRVPASTVAFKHRFQAALPTAGTIQIDHRKGAVRYYRTHSCIKLLDDGGVLIEGGCGEQLRLQHGNAYLTAPGDVFTLPGRSAVTLAPFDLIQRAGNSVDVTAALGDVRIKAQKNLHMLGGNDGRTGGVLVECRAAGVPSAADFAKTGQRVNGHGIILKCARGALQTIARETHIGGSNLNGVTPRITLDAGKGGTLYMRGKDVLARARKSFVIHLAKETGKPESLAFTKQGAVLSTNIQLGGQVVMAARNGSANLILAGDIICHGGAAFQKSVISNVGFASAGARTVGGLEKPVELKPDRDKLREKLDEQVTTLDEVVEALDAPVAGDAAFSPGHADYQAKVGFSLRATKEDLKLDTGTFVLYEGRWQQMLREGGVKTTWEEPYVVAPGGEKTLPYPGLEGWEQVQAYREVQPENVTSTGVPKKRAELKDKAKDPRKVTLKAGYIINVQK